MANAPNGLVSSDYDQDVKPVVSGEMRIPSSSKQMIQVRNEDNGDVKPIIKERSSPSPKGKEQARDEDEEDREDDDDIVMEEPKEELAEDMQHIGRPSDGLDEDEVILIGTAGKANVVGIKHQGGIRTLKTGMKVEFRRDRLNFHDKNAIEVRHTGKGAKIGMINKVLAGRLAPLIDQGLIEIRGVAAEVPLNPVGVEQFPCALSIYGKRAVGRDSRLDWLFPSRSQRASLLAKAKKKVSDRLRDDEGENMSRSSSTASSSKSDRGLISHQQKLEHDVLMEQSMLVEKDRKTLGDPLGELFKEGALDPARLPMHPCPPGKRDKTMRTDLMDFQKQGLAWMIRMEHPRLPKDVDDPPVQLWQRKKDLNGQTFYYNVATERSQRDKPLLKRGGVLADEMGLGKTLTTIALITTDDTGEGVLDQPEEPDERFDDMTLIVCPLSVASNWTNQLHHHVGSKRLRWHLYHGDGRSLTKNQLRKFDVIIATYQTLAAEISDVGSSRSATIELTAEEDEPKQKKAKTALKKDDTLHQIKWRRVVLDEGHVIKNPKAKMTMACISLKAERRWVLTGTPIVNSSTDLGAMLSFLRMCKPLDEREEWLRYVGDGKNVTDQNAKTLRAIVASTTLCRTKDMKDSSGRLLVQLPKITFYELKIELDPETRALYDEIATQLKDIVRAYMSKGTTGTHYQDVLVFLLRLRQLACDSSLCPESFLEAVHSRQLARQLEEGQKKLPSVSRLPSNGGLEDELRRQLARNESCLICGDLPVNPRLTSCKHLYCAVCLEELFEQYSSRCVMCGKAVRSGEVAELEGAAGDAASVLDEDEVLERQQKEGAKTTSPKLEKLIMLLKSDPTAKSLVFSQWTTHLNCIEAGLERAGISSCRFDGGMTQAKREEMIKTFSKPPPEKKLKKGEKPPPMVMLISLKAGALGLNLTCANQVFLMDPWWQASIETQAIDRVYRIGQTREVKVYQFIAENTVEDRVIEIQNRKNERISQAFSGNKEGFKPRQKVQVRKLDEILHVLDM